jgi:hypothetical protein
MYSENVPSLWLLWAPVGPVVHFLRKHDLTLSLHFLPYMPLQFPYSTTKMYHADKYILVDLSATTLSTYVLLYYIS